VTTALIVADGDLPSRAALDRLLEPAGQRLVVAADGGALKAEQAGLRPHVVVGDADSLSPAEIERLRAADVEVVVHSPAKDHSDTELAVREAISRGASSVLIVGAFGGRRIEHTLANVLLLATPDLAAHNIRLADEASVLRVLTGPARLEVEGEAGDYVSLLPLTELVSGVATDGLAYPLVDAQLFQGPTRGLSNELIGTTASVSVATGRLAVVHTRRSETWS